MQVCSQTQDRGAEPDMVWLSFVQASQAQLLGFVKDWHSTQLGKAKNETECSINLKSGHIIRIVGLDNFDDLRGAGLWFFVGDEWADCKEQAWTDVIRPMLATCGGHALFIGTPKGYNHFYDGWVRGFPTSKEYANNKSFTYTSIDGGNVPQSEIDEALATLPLKTFKQEWQATFEEYGGRVVYAFDRTKHVKPCLYDPNLPIHVGMDFNVNPMTALIFQEDKGVTYQVGEIIIPTSDTHEMGEAIAQTYGSIVFDPISNRELRRSVVNISVYPDPAGAQRRTSAQGKTDISILKDRGFNVVALSSHPLVRDRVAATNARFMSADGKISKYVDPSCKVSIKAYERHVYKEGTSEPDKTTGFDHPVDASGYYDYARFGRTGFGLVPTNHMQR